MPSSSHPHPCPPFRGGASSLYLQRPYYCTAFRVERRALRSNRPPQFMRAVTVTLTVTSALVLLVFLVALLFLVFVLGRKTAPSNRQPSNFLLLLLVLLLLAVVASSSSSPSRTRALPLVVLVVLLSLGAEIAASRIAVGPD